MQLPLKYSTVRSPSHLIASSGAPTRTSTAPFPLRFHLKHDLFAKEEPQTSPPQLSSKGTFTAAISSMERCDAEHGAARITLGITASVLEALVVFKAFMPSNEAHEPMPTTIAPLICASKIPQYKPCRWIASDSDVSSFSKLSQGEIRRSLFLFCGVSVDSVSAMNRMCDCPEHSADIRLAGSLNTFSVIDDPSGAKALIVPSSEEITISLPKHTKCIAADRSLISTGTDSLH
mmetsp:Transcript_4285/g.11073  ORF Transcript_4285/g.11073 Transcript_4285/m.11073 type:complete len:233 (-) Transcript_4285:319-1017(-)